VARNPKLAEAHPRWMAALECTRTGRKIFRTCRNRKQVKWPRHSPGCPSRTGSV
jgi:hypothetical protein